MKFCLSTLRKSVKKNQVSKMPDKNNGHFTWRPMYTYGSIKFSFS